MKRFLAVGVIAVAPATWWIVGRDFDRDVEFSDPDYMWEPIGVPDNVATAIGVVSTLVVIAAFVVVVRAIRDGSLGTRSLGVVIPLALVTAYAGMTYAVATAPVVGANIGGGILVLFGVPVVLVLLVIAGATAWSMGWRRGRESRSSSQR